LLINFETGEQKCSPVVFIKPAPFRVAYSSIAGSTGATHQPFLRNANEKQIIFYPPVVPTEQNTQMTEQTPSTHALKDVSAILKTSTLKHS